MARLVNITADSSFASIIGRHLERLGHEVLTMSALKGGGELLAFEPDAIIVSLARRAGAMGDRVDCPEVEVSGLDVLRDLTGLRGGLNHVPIIIVGRGFTASGLPPGMRYTEFARFTSSFRHLRAALTRVLQGASPRPEIGPQARRSAREAYRGNSDSQLGRWPGAHQKVHRPSGEEGHHGQPN